MASRLAAAGHNFFGEELSDALATLSREQRASYILMQRILPRRSTAVLVRDGATVVGGAASELGVYSALLTDRKGRVVLNRAASASRARASTPPLMDPLMDTAHARRRLTSTHTGTRRTSMGTDTRTTVAGRWSAVRTYWTRIIMVTAPSRQRYCV